MKIYFFILLLSVFSWLFISATAEAQPVTPTILHIFDGQSSGGLFGNAVSGVGDINGDGFDDVIVGEPLDDSNGAASGSVRVFSGADGSILHILVGDSAGDLFGQSVSGTGDVNGDGVPDFIVGAYWADNNGYNSGSARVFSGLDGSVLYVFEGDSYGDFFGFSVSSSGDVNGDGVPDFIIGAYWDDNSGNYSGSARVYSGFDGSNLYTFEGDSAGDGFGVSVSGAGDVNGDGFADLIIGAWGDDSNGLNSGSARVFSGADGSILYTLLGESAGDAFGYSVSGTGDIDGDGFSDFIVGAYRDDNNGEDSGSARVFSGIDGSIIIALSGDAAGDQFGNSVSGAGDVNGDGHLDFIVGAYEDDNNGIGSGSARVFSGGDGSILCTFSGESESDLLGRSVAAAGDVNGDGYADVIVGAVWDDNASLNSGSACVLSLAPALFRRGDLNGDGSFDLADPIRALMQFMGSLDNSCFDASDANDDGQINIADPIAMLNAIVLGGSSPPDPGPSACGPDLTPDSLNCETYTGCP
ncbi:MAG TPA: hypothetical protein EYN00_04945 [Planctomycetes bacterium]|nr:hypothetical protein [Planctomycetota bacterium]